MAVEVQPNDLRRRLDDGEDIYLLDVREPFEVEEWTFPGAVNIPLGQLGSRSTELPVDRVIVVICHAGVRSATATDALVKGGWRAESLAGGTAAWTATAGS
jgi:rhodanese-related sulfurtransferase